MKKTTIFSCAVATVAVGLVGQAYAADDLWTGAADTVITNPLNYSAGTVNLATNRQVFNLATAGVAGLSVTVPVANTAITNTVFDTAAGNYTFSGNTILFQSNGGSLVNLLSTLTGTPTITVNNNIQDFNARTTNASLLPTNSKSGSTLILNGNIIGGATTGQSVGVAFKMASQTGATLATTITSNGVISDGVSGGNVVVSRTGGGGALTVLNLNGANTYSGGFEFGNGSGVVSLGNKSAFGTGAFRVIEAGGMTVQSSTPLTGANAVANTVNFVSGAFSGNTTTNLVLSFNAGSNTATYVSGTLPAVGDSVRAGNGAVLPINVRVTGVSGTTVTFDANAIATATSGSLTTAPINSSGAGTLTFAGTNDLEFSGTQNLTTLFSNGAAATQTFNVTNTGTTTFSGVLQQLGGVASISKTGVGRLVLSGANTYTGTTTVAASGGTLLANNTTGSATGTGAVSVLANDTFGGTGAVSGAVTTAATSILAPGTPGTPIESLNVGSATIAGKLQIEYDVAASTPIDLLASTGALDITAATLDFDNINVAALPLVGGSYVFATYGSLTGAAFASVLDLPAGYSINYAFGGNNIALVSAVPEPAALGLLFVGASALVARRRRA